MLEKNKNKIQHRWLNAFVFLMGLSMVSLISSAFLRKIPTNEMAVHANDSLQNAQESLSQIRGLVLGQTETKQLGVLTSEHYALGKIALGGDVAFLSSGDGDAGTLNITDVRGESFVDKGKKDANVLITWKTTTLSSAVLTYGKNGTDAKTVVEEDGFGLNHSLMLSGLDQATTYVYSLTAKDRAGNEVSTQSYAVYTSSKIASLFDVIAGAVTDTFGWAIGK